MSMLTFYADESGTDSNSERAVVGGLLLDPKGYFWLDVEWREVQRQFGIPTALHMREFGQHGVLGGIPPEVRRCLFAQLVKVINENKIASMTATLAAETYRRVFKGVSNLSMYGACFAQLVMMNDAEAKRVTHGKPIPFVLDDGNSYKKHIVQAKNELGSQWPSLSMVSFSTDSSLCALQAADVLVWSVRRRLVGDLPCGFEPLQALFDQHHRDIEYVEEWMVGVANSIRDKASTRGMALPDPS